MSTTAADTTLTCPTCSRPWTLTADRAAWFAAKGMAAPRRCADCRRASAARHRERICNACSSTFAYDPGRYEDAGLHPPGRCPACLGVARSQRVTVTGRVVRVHVTSHAGRYATVETDTGERLHWALRHDSPHVPNHARVTCTVDPAAPTTEGRLRYARDVVVLP